MRTVWPAEWSVCRYGDGFPIEQTRSRRGAAILMRERLQIPKRVREDATVCNSFS